MKLIINGKTTEAAQGITLPQLIEQLGLAHKPIVIEINQQAIAPSEFEQQSLSENDQIEIITIAAGG